MKYLSGMVSFENNFTEISWVLHKENQENTKISKCFLLAHNFSRRETYFHANTIILHFFRGVSFFKYL